jgi:hypothetical protein
MGRGAVTQSIQAMAQPPPSFNPLGQDLSNLMQTAPQHESQGFTAIQMHVTKLFWLAFFHFETKVQWLKLSNLEVEHAWWFYGQLVPQHYHQSQHAPAIPRPEHKNKKQTHKIKKTKHKIKNKTKNKNKKQKQKTKNNTPYNY